MTVTNGNNLVGNPSFEADTSGWNTAGFSTVTLTRVSSGPHSGSWSALLTNTGTAPQYCILNDSPNWVATTVAGTYTASIWVRADTAGASLKLKIREYTNGNTAFAGQNSTIVTLTTAWQQVIVTYVPVSPGSTLDFQVYVPNAAVGTCFYADDASITAA